MLMFICSKCFVDVHTVRQLKLSLKIFSFCVCSWPHANTFCLYHHVRVKVDMSCDVCVLNLPSFFLFLPFTDHWIECYICSLWVLITPVIKLNEFINYWCFLCAFSLSVPHWDLCCEERPWVSGSRLSQGIMQVRNHCVFT